MHSLVSAHSLSLPFSVYSSPSLPGSLPLSFPSSPRSFFSFFHPSLTQFPTSNLNSLFCLSSVYEKKFLPTQGQQKKRFYQQFQQMSWNWLDSFSHTLIPRTITVTRGTRPTRPGSLSTLGYQESSQLTWAKRTGMDRGIIFQNIGLRKQSKWKLEKPTPGSKTKWILSLN